ncbi:hypothetical protein ACRRTK_012080 [Alexandromys fortis]
MLTFTLSTHPESSEPTASQTDCPMRFSDQSGHPPGAYIFLVNTGPDLPRESNDWLQKATPTPKFSRRRECVQR